MVALFISILVSLTTLSTDANTSTTKEGPNKPTTTTQSATTFGGSTTWAEGTF